jgi:ubiquinol-cytochrome c reductase subunit 6
MDDGDPVDPRPAIVASCEATIVCQKLRTAYEACGKRVEAKGSGNCAGQFMDWLGCVDTCVRTHAATLRLPSRPTSLLSISRTHSTSRSPPLDRGLTLHASLTESNGACRRQGLRSMRSSEGSSLIVYYRGPHLLTVQQSRASTK